MQEQAEAMLRISVALVEICEQVAGELRAMRAQVLRAHAVDTIEKVDARLGQATQGPRSAVGGLHEPWKHNTFHHHVPPDVHAPAQNISASMQMPAITSTPGHAAVLSTGSAEKPGIWVQWFPRESPQVEEMAAVGSPRSMANASDASLQSVSERLAP